LKIIIFKLRVYERVLPEAAKFKSREGLVGKR